MTPSKSQLRDAGIYYENGIATHSLGDEYAQQIISGEISIDKAIRMEKRSAAMGRPIPGISNLLEALAPSEPIQPSVLDMAPRPMSRLKKSKPVIR